MNPANEFDAKWRDSLRCSRPTFYVPCSGNSMMIGFLTTGTTRLLRCVGCALALAALLAGCHSDAYYDAQAPSPTLNPHPQKVSHLKITVEPGSGVTRVEVHSTWVISNLGCAPRRWPSGSTIQKEVDVKEKVEKMDGYYLAIIRDDYYFTGKCQWFTDPSGAILKFLHNDTLVASGHGSPELFQESNPLKLVCIPPPHVPPLCELRKV